MANFFKLNLDLCRNPASSSNLNEDLHTSNAILLNSISFNGALHDEDAMQMLDGLYPYFDQIIQRHSATPLSHYSLGSLLKGEPLPQSQVTGRQVFFNNIWIFKDFENHFVIMGRWVNGLGLLKGLIQRFPSYVCISKSFTYTMTSFMKRSMSCSRTLPHVLHVPHNH